MLNIYNTVDNFLKIYLTLPIINSNRHFPIHSIYHQIHIFSKIISQTIHNYLLIFHIRNPVFPYSRIYIFFQFLTEILFSVKRAVNECIKEGILSEFLLKNKAEVIKMSIYEYDKEFEEKKLRKAEFEYGQHELLKTQIQKKLAKGKSINEFADALEGSPLVIQNFINELEYEKAHSELNL